MVLFIALVSVIGFGFWAEPGIQWDEAPFLAIVAGAGLLIFVDAAKKNAFAIFTRGLNPPSRPLSKFLGRSDYFIPYKDIVEVRLEEDIEATGDREAHPYTFYFNLSSGRILFINPVGGFGALGRYIKTEREMAKVYKLLKVVMEELNRPENRPRAERGEDVLILKERFESLLKYWKPAQEAPRAPRSGTSS